MLPRLCHLRKPLQLQQCLALQLLAFHPSLQHLGWLPRLLRSEAVLLIPSDTFHMRFLTVIGGQL